MRARRASALNLLNAANKTRAQKLHDVEDATVATRRTGVSRF
jgi:hypothetical protein